MRISRRISRHSSVSTTTEPRNPHSSPTVQKMKSVCFSGTNPYLIWVPSRKPLPQKLPEPMAIFAWLTL